MLEQTRAEKSLRSVLSDLENLEYEINIFQKIMKWRSWKFSIQVKEYLPPAHMPVWSARTSGENWHVSWFYHIIGRRWSGKGSISERRQQTGQVAFPCQLMALLRIALQPVSRKRKPSHSPSRRNKYEDRWFKNLLKKKVLRLYRNRLGISFRSSWRR